MTYHGAYKYDFNLDQNKNQEAAVCPAINLPRLFSKSEQCYQQQLTTFNWESKLIQIVMVYDTYALSR